MGRHRLIIRSRRARLATGAALAALGVATSVVAVVQATTAGAATGGVPLTPLATGLTRPVPAALSAALETVRSAEANRLYGSPTVPSLAERKTSIVSMGDSEISGEGLGNFVAGTDGPANYCHRSHDSAILKTGLAVDVPVNLACSGAQTQHLVPAAQGGGARQYDDPNQGDSLSVTARTTRVAMVLLVIGANDPGAIEFGPVMGDCVQRRILFQGNCWPDYTNGWRGRVTRTQEYVTKAIASIRQTMRDAGYLDGDYQLVAMSYPSPISPDVEDNPRFPGWYDGGCLAYLKDAAFGRNKAVPMFEQAERAAALAAPGVRYLDNSQLFAGHEACADTPWANGMVFQDGNILNLGEHNTQMSFHPNALGAAAFASCLTQLYPTRDTAATCLDANHTNKPTLRPGLLNYQRLRDLGTGLCVDATGYNSRNGTKLVSYPCTGGRNQGFWYDSADSTIHSELTVDRCVDVPNGTLTAGTALQLHTCNGQAAQKFIMSGEFVKVAGNPALCLGFGPDKYLGQALTLQPCGAGKFALRPQLTELTEIKTKSAGQCLDLPGSKPNLADTLKVFAVACDGKDDQKWWYNDISGRFHNFRDLAYCLDGGSATVGGQLITSTCDSAKSATQQWLWTDGVVRLKQAPALVAEAASDAKVRLAKAVAGTAETQWSTGAGLPDRFGFTYSDFIGTRAN